MTHPPPRYECWIVCGSRDLTDSAWVRARLHQLAKRHGHPKVLMHGDARGADRIAKEWGLLLQASTGMDVRHRPADWDKFGKGAGPKRNRAMAEEASQFATVLVVAFPMAGGESVGTMDMVGVAARHGFVFVGMPYRPHAGV